MDTICTSEMQIKIHLTTEDDRYRKNKVIKQNLTTILVAHFTSQL